MRIVAALALVLGGCIVNLTDGREPSDPPKTDPPKTDPPNDPPRTERLSVNVWAAGDVFGTVRIDPVGTECATTGQQDAPTACVADAPLATPITLWFTPQGAARTAQFNVTRGGTLAECDRMMAGSNGTGCVLELAPQTTVDVFPISEPPPP